MPHHDTAQDISLMLPTADLRESFFDMIDEYQAAGEDRYDWIIERFGDDFGSYMKFLDDMSLGVNLPADHVPQTTYWLVRDGRRIIGASRLRHDLNAQLMEWGGHIGYDVRPSERRKRYGTLLLSLTLRKARQLGLERVIVTCNAANAASIRVIQNNNGRFESEYFLPRVKATVRKYAIDRWCFTSTGMARPSRLE